jgi:hypothetical protein
MILEYMKVPLHRYTFKPLKLRRWVETQASGKVLNLFAGETILKCDEERNDIRPEMPADFHMDALKCVETWPKDEYFNTILLDPPYGYRKSMEMYDGAVSSPFNAIKNKLSRILTPHGRVITFGYHSVSMGKSRGFEQERILLMSHGGAIHDTIAVVEIKA